jgi:hypothetical protein
MKTQEQVVPVTVSAGASGQVSNLINLPPGKIVAVAAFFRDYSAINSGFVRASIKDVTGFEVSQMQSISNYRDREAGYLEGKNTTPIGWWFTSYCNGTSYRSIYIKLFS